MKKIHAEEQYPVFEFVIDEENEESLSLVSLVDDPAIELKGICFSKIQDLEEQLFSNKEKQIIAGPAILPNKRIKRKDDNGNVYMGYFSKETIVKMVDIFNKNMKDRPKGVINNEHTNEMVDAYITGSWIVESSTHDKSKMYGFDLPIGTWFIEVKVDDEKFWNEQVKGEGKYGFSIESLLGLKRVAMSKIEEPTDWIDILQHIGWLPNDKKFNDFLKSVDFRSTPPFHENCRCELSNGVIVNQENCCDFCVEKSNDYNL